MKALANLTFNRGLFLLLALTLLAGCPPSPQKEAPKPGSLERIPFSQAPAFRDDRPTAGLKTAIERSLSYYGRVPDDRLYPFGDRHISAKVLKESLLAFLALIDAGRLDSASISDSFDIYRIIPGNEKDCCLITGYYEPVLEGRLQRSEVFRWPVYRIPPDLLTIELDTFDPGRFKGERLVGRLNHARVVPYYSRAEIDGQNQLQASGTELAWLKDPVDAFFLHVQGSGVIRFEDGSSRRVGYAGANGRPYRSIGKHLMDRGLIAREEMSLQSIRAYLKAHPEERDRIMWENESYVFFRWVPEGPVGSQGLVLTEKRSIATDPRYHPRAALAFIAAEKPQSNAQKNVTEWEPITGWVLNHDTGGAIKGPDRIDFFCGTGDAAETLAGPMKQPGQLYYMIKKGELLAP